MAYLRTGLSLGNSAIFCKLCAALSAARRPGPAFDIGAWGCDAASAPGHCAYLPRPQPLQQALEVPSHLSTSRCTLLTSPYYKNFYLCPQSRRCSDVGDVSGLLQACMTCRGALRTPRQQADCTEQLSCTNAAAAAVCALATSDCTLHRGKLRAVLAQAHVRLRIHAMPSRLGAWPGTKSQQPRWQPGEPPWQ